MKKALKLTTTVILIVALLFSMTGCGEVQEAQKTVTGLFAALKSANLERVSEYIAPEEFMAGEENEEAVISDAEMIVENMFKQFDYKIISSEKKDSSTVVISAEITNTDMKPVMGEFMVAALQYAFANAFANPQPSEEETNKKMEELLVASITKPDLATVTNDVNITVVKKDGKWQIKPDEALMNALLGGLYQALDDMENSFNSVE